MEGELEKDETEKKVRSNLFFFSRFGIEYIIIDEQITRTLMFLNLKIILK